ncbi:MAG: hypothetical protein QM703_00005 [Gemmatales bacterium]
MVLVLEVSAAPLKVSETESPFAVHSLQLGLTFSADAQVISDQGHIDLIQTIRYE